MTDGIIKGDGTSRLLKGSAPATYDEFRALFNGDGVPVDVIFNSEGWQILPTFLNKANLLSDEVAEQYGLDSSTVLNSVFQVLANAAILKDGNLQLPNGGTVPGIRTEYGTYKGTGQYGDGHPNKITVPFDLQIVIVAGRYAGRYGFLTILIKDMDRATIDLREGVIVSWTNNSVSWYSTVSASSQLNESGTTYYYFAIGVEK